MRSAAVLFAVLAVASGVLASDYTWTLNNPGASSSFYTITGTGSVSGQNPTVTLPYGKTLHLDITTDAIHPVCIQTTNAVTGASDYANVVPANPACVTSGTMDITLPASGSGTSVLYLHCHNHAFAITLNLQDPAVPSSSSTGAAAVSSSAAQSSTGGAAVVSSTGPSGPDYTWTLTNPSAADFFYTISGTGSVAGNNPTVTLPAGKTLHLNIASTSSHPVCVQTNNAVTGASNYANVVPANPACVTTGTMDITLPSAASGTSAIYLHCEFHTFAVTINIDSGAGGSSTGGNAASGTAVASAAVVLLATAAAIALRA